MNGSLLKSDKIVSQITTKSFECVDFWPKILLYRTQNIWNSKTEMTFIQRSFFQCSIHLVTSFHFSSTPCQQIANQKQNYIVSIYPYFLFLCKVYFFQQPTQICKHWYAKVAQKIFARLCKSLNYTRHLFNFSMLDFNPVTLHHLWFSSLSRVHVKIG